MDYPGSPSGQIDTLLSDDESMDEWERIQRRINGDQRKASMKIRSLCEENDQSIVNADELRESVAEKELANVKRQQDGLDLQARFVWDLAFATKSCLVEEAGATSMDGVRISQVSLRSIIDDAETEDPRPHEWTTWIEGKFQ